MFNNIYLYLFILLFVIHFFFDNKVNYYNKFFPEKVEISTLDFLKFLHQYLKNNNILFSYFILLFYVFIAIIPLVIMRIARLNNPVILDISAYTSLGMFIPLLCFILSLTYFFHIIGIIVYPYMLKTHYYLHFTFEKYRDFMAYNTFIKDWLLYRYITTIALFFNIITLNNKDFIILFKQKLRFNLLFGDQNILRKETLFYLKFRYYVNKYFFIKVICKGLLFFFDKLAFNISRFFYYVPQLTIVVCLAYDLMHGVFYYVFYALLYYYISNILKKIRQFYYEKDPVYDNILSTYFYSDEVLYKELGSLSEDELESTSAKLLSLKEKAPQITRIIEEKSLILQYIKDDFKVYYVTDIKEVATTTTLNSIYKRIHLLFVLTLFNIYTIYYNKYVLICCSMELNLYFLSIPILCLLYYIHRKIAVYQEHDWVENKKSKILFFLVAICYAFVIIYLFLKNKLDPCMLDFIVNFKNILYIKENFTLAEKYTYMNNLILQMKKENLSDVDILNNILESMKTQYIISEMTLGELQSKMEELYSILKKAQETPVPKNSSLWYFFEKLFKK